MKAFLKALQDYDDIVEGIIAREHKGPIELTWQEQQRLKEIRIEFAFAHEAWLEKQKL